MDNHPGFIGRDPTVQLQSSTVVTIDNTTGVIMSRHEDRMRDEEG